VVSTYSRSGFTCGDGFNDGIRSGLTGVVVVALWWRWVTVVVVVFESTIAIMTGPELNTTNDLLSKLLQQLGTMGINCTTATTNHTSTPTVVAYHTGPPHLAGPTAGPVPTSFPPRVHYTPTALVGPNPTAPYNYNMKQAQSNVTPTGLPSHPTSITV
ncbi:hypothetical protein Tco_1433983, partial [Tanacetum coccineum]